MGPDLKVGDAVRYPHTGSQSWWIVAGPIGSGDVAGHHRAVCIDTDGSGHMRVVTTGANVHNKNGEAIIRKATEEECRLAGIEYVGEAKQQAPDWVGCLRRR